jgi:hypothetical protein
VCITQGFVLPSSNIYYNFGTNKSKLSIYIDTEWYIIVYVLILE